TTANWRQGPSPSPDSLPWRQADRSRAWPAAAETGRHRPRASGAAVAAQGSRLADQRLQARQGRAGPGRAVDLAVVLASRQRKGGNATARALGAKLTDHHLEAGQLVAEPLGNLRQGPSLDEEGLQGDIAAMEGRLGFQEVAAAEWIVHDAISHQ